MAEQEQRRKIRVKIAGHLSGRLQATVDIRLVDLSASGARIEHFGFLQIGTICTFEFPSELGALVLSGRVVRSTVVGKEQGPEGEERLRYESGLAFIDLTPEQEAALANILT